MARTLDCDGELALLLGAKAGLGDWLNATIYVDVALKGLYIAVIEV